MKKLKVVTIVGTRPEIIRLSMLIPKLDEHTDHIFVHTGQNSDPRLNQIFFQDLGLREPDLYLNVDTSSMGAVMGDTLKKAEEIFLRENPDAVMILGDTNSAIAAVVAERMNVPVYHMEAGNRSFDNNVPEELNRRMVDHVASFNLPYNDFSLRNLLAEGIHPRRTMKTGSPLGEIAAFYDSRIRDSKILEKLKLTEKGYFLSSIHRQENVDSPHRLALVLSSLQELGATYGFPVVMTTHPRTRKRLESFNLALYPNIIFEDPFGFTDYNMLQLNAACVISDSGTIFEESTILGFRAVCLRDSMERPEAFEAGAALLAAIESNDLLEIVELALSSEPGAQLPEGYEVSNFSEKVLKFVLSTAHLRDKWLGINKRI